MKQDQRDIEQGAKDDMQEKNRALSDSEWRTIGTRKLELDTRIRRRSAREHEMDFGRKNVIILSIIVACIILVWIISVWIVRPIFGH